MAAYLALKDKTTKELYTKQKLIELDERFCEELGVKPDTKDWVLGWMDIIGIRLALGKSASEILENGVWNSEYTQLLIYIRDNFDNKSYMGF